jgi:RimJ/RimL family protein N-acetyltransferase
MTAPVLHTDRLILRPHDLADYGVFRDFRMSDRARHIGGPLLQEHEVWRQFSAERGHWALRGFGLWTLVGRASGQVLGWVGLQQPPHYDVPELAWHMTAAGEGQGLAHEAVRAALGHGRGQLGVSRAISYVATTNLRSLRLAERLGAVMAERGSFQGTDYVRFDHLEGPA